MTTQPIHPEHPPQRGIVARELLALAWPIALSMLSYSLMTAVDTYFVGRLGASAIAAVGLGGLVSFTLLTFGMGLLRAGKIIVARTVGAAHGGEVMRLAAATLAVAMLSAVITWGLTLAVAPLLGHIFDEPEANRFVVSYVTVRSTAVPLVLTATALRELSQGAGDSRSPMWAAVAANIINIPLNALFVGSLGWGVAGSAGANVLAQCVDLACLVWQRRHWVAALRHTEWALALQIALRGLPLGAEMLLDVGAFSVLGIILARLGAVEMAAHQIAVQISQLSVLPIVALGEAASILCGNAVGQRRLGRVPLILRAGILIGVVWAAVTGILLLAFPWVLVGKLTPDPGVQSLTVIVLYPVVGFQIAFSLYSLSKSVLRGLGDIRYAATVTVGAAWLCTPPAAWLLGHKLGWGIVGGWCALGIEITIASVIYLVRLERGGWRKHLESLNVIEPRNVDMEIGTNSVGV